MAAKAGRPLIFAGIDEYQTDNKEMETDDEEEKALLRDSKKLSPSNCRVSSVPSCVKDSKTGNDPGINIVAPSRPFHTAQTLPKSHSNGLDGDASDDAKMGSKVEIRGGLSRTATIFETDLKRRKIKQ